MQLPLAASSSPGASGAAATLDPGAPATYKASWLTKQPPAQRTCTAGGATSRTIMSNSGSRSSASSSGEGPAMPAMPLAYTTEKSDWEKDGGEGGRGRGRWR